MKKTCTDKHVSAWQETTSSFRNNLDLATLFLFWGKVDENFDLKKTFDSILVFFDIDDISHIPPRQLWGSLLGGSKAEQSIRDLLRSSDNMYERDILGGIKYTEPPKHNHSLFSLSRHRHPIRSKCNTFDIDKWDLIIQTTKPHISETTQYSLKWFLLYRQAICEVTPFSDYFVTKRIPGKSQEVRSAEYNYANGGIDTIEYEMIIDNLDPFIEENDYRLLFFEDQVINHEEDIYSTGLACRADVFDRLEGMCIDNGTYKPNFHPILGNPFYTHSFINLDLLIEKADEFGFSIPNELRKQAVNNSPINDEIQQKTEASTEALANETYPVNIKIQFYCNEQFPLIQLAPIIIEYLTHDPVGKELLSNQTPPMIRKILSNTTDLPLEHINHIWRLIVPPHKRKSANSNNLHLQNEIIGIRNNLWLRDDFENMWRNEDIELILIDAGYTTKEAKSINALLSPKANKTPRRLNKEQLIKYRDVIMAIDLSWTKISHLYS